MAPIKFEERLKEKLEKRTLSPSPVSWSQLADRLDEDNKTSKKPVFWWLSIAAGLIVMIAVSVHFFDRGEVESEIPKVVDEQTKDEKLIKEQNLNDQIELASDYETSEDKKERVETQKPHKVINFKNDKGTVSQPKIQVVENTILPLKNPELNTKAVLSKDPSKDLDEAALKTTVATVLKELKSEKTSTTEREVDSLLKEASKALFKERLQKESSKTVDAKTLLISVEEDMGQSFRSKVFDALKGSYETVKTAVVQRNN